MQNSSQPARTPLPLDLEPDDEWKWSLKVKIEAGLRSMVDEANQKLSVELAKGIIRPEERSRLTAEHLTTLSTIRQLSEEQFLIALERERQERQWASGAQLDQAWSKSMMEEQQAILDRTARERNNKATATSLQADPPQSLAPPPSLPPSLPPPPPRTPIHPPDPTRKESIRCKPSMNARHTVQEFWKPSITPEEDPQMTRTLTIARRGGTANATSSLKAPSVPSAAFTDPLDAPYAKMDQEQPSIHSADQEWSNDRIQERDREHERPGYTHADDRSVQSSQLRKRFSSQDTRHHFQQEGSYYGPRHVPPHREDFEEDGPDDGFDNRSWRIRNYEQRRIQDIEEGLRKREEAANRREEELARKAEELKREDDVRKKRVEEQKREEARRQEAGAKQREDDGAEREAKLRRKEEEVRIMEEEVRRRVFEAKRKQEEARRMEEEARRRAEEVSRKAAETQRKEEELRKREDELKRGEEVLNRREAEMRRKEDDKLQEEFRRREEEIRRQRAEERKKQDVWDTLPPEKLRPISTPQTSNSSGPWPIPNRNDRSTSSATSSPIDQVSASTSDRSDPVSSWSTTKPTSTTNTQASSTLNSPPLMEAEFYRRQAEQAQQREEQFRREQARLAMQEHERQAKSGKTMSKK